MAGNHIRGSNAHHATGLDGPCDSRRDFVVGRVGLGLIGRSSPAFDANVDVRTLTVADVAGLTTPDLPELPPQVREALVTPVGYGSSSSVSDDASASMTAHAADLSADVCYT